MRITIKKGLDIPIEGQPEQTITDGPTPRTVAAVATDVSGIRPRMAVQVGDRVRLGQALYHDKRNPGVPFAAPGAGEVIEINRGSRRALQSVVIRLDGDEAEEFKSYAPDALSGLDRQEVRDNLIASGQWTMFRTRPFSRIPAPDATPAAIFVTAMDTRPLAVSVRPHSMPCTRRRPSQTRVIAPVPSNSSASSAGEPARGSMMTERTEPWTVTRSRSQQSEALDSPSCSDLLRRAAASCSSGEETRRVHNPRRPTRCRCSCIRTS